ncbi:50S ribosomal protein L7/L12 [Thermogemmatispora onikobensis]|uniref:50S ribosomal protein L7/L12 n=1 Tax=Thermogemmatispora onikobensis TaxID=732234 RepID=UPI0008535445|nr:50S ribosomal protein L7/L12 [Thermogemmatispora onikobensis]
MSIESIIAEIEKLNVLDLVELTKQIQEKWGVSAAPVAVAAAPAAAAPAEAAPAAQQEEKTDFDVILSEVGAEKIKVIKVVRELTNLGLKEAKELVEGAPKPVKEGVSKEEAQQIAAKLQEVGAKVTIK